MGTPTSLETARAVALALTITLFAGAASAATEIVVLSNRADLISGGDALVAVVPPPPAGTVVDLDGDDISSAFALRADGSYAGLVEGLAVGASTLTVTLPDASGASISIENHPQEGPVFSGPHLQPWDCTTESAGLGPADDEHCNVAPLVEWFCDTGSGYSACDPENLPAGIETISPGGVPVRNIVRRETGSINRGLYSFAVLHDPDEPQAPWQKQDGWNGKLYYPFQASCNTNQTQGSSKAGTVLNATRLEQGWAIATTSLNELGHLCNPIISAETAMMTKERFVEQYGQVRYTMSTGGSGGAIGQMVVANAYPGITNGLMPGQMFADIWTTGIEVGDCALFETYWPTSTLTPLQRAAVDGHGPPQSSCAAWVGTFVPSGIPTTGCFSGATIPTASTPDPTRDYNPVTNPDGCRATVNDLQVSVLGRRRKDGFARRPLDNVGVQYGLEALNLPITDPGKITFAQFLDLNTRMGGNDIDGLPQTERTRADALAVEYAHRASLINDGRGLARAAIINFANSINVEIHTSYHAYAMEARLAELGHEDNHAIWHSGPSGTAWDTMDLWLSEIEADGGIDPLTGMDPALVKANAPASAPGAPLGATDSCWSSGSQTALGDCAGEVFGDLRRKAGMPIQHDTVQCQLKPIDPADYAGAVPAPTALDLMALEAVFPEGVCDYGVDGQNVVPSVEWLSYENGPGGEPLGTPPASTPF